VFILKGVKVLCFHTLLQVLILNGLVRDGSANEQEGKSRQGNRAGDVDWNLRPLEMKKAADTLPLSS
jgi:hypothetical protein